MKLALPTRPVRRTSKPAATIRRRMAALLAVVTLAVAGALALQLPAQALEARLLIGTGLSSCPAGYVCLWKSDNYLGQGYAFYNDEGNYSVLPAPFNGINNTSFSFYNHGNFSDIRFFRDGDPLGHSFLLCKGESIAFLPLNVDVDPPVGTANEPGNGWRDQVSGHDFGVFC